MNYLSISKEDMANGVGSRVVLWVSGCEHGCCNCRSKFTWDYKAGQLFTNKTLDEICLELSKDYCDGITLSGGDPLAIGNRIFVTHLCGYIKNIYPTKSIWCYTGYNWEDLFHLEIMKNIDVLVDGKYIDSISLPSPKWCGSTNQRIIDVQESLIKEEVVLYNIN